ncbi:hypothetical protein ACYDMD_20085 [Pantoea agglomerans]|jgi:hypothetical protein
MLTFNGAARTLVALLTLFFVFSAYVLLHYGTPLVKFLMMHSSFYAWDLAMRTALLVLSALAGGSLMATASLFIWHAVPGLVVRPDRLRRTPQLQK